MYQIIITPFATNHIDVAFLYYDSIRMKLGDQLLNELDKAFFYLERYPAIGSIRYREVRCFVLRKFPYMVHYIINEKSRSVTIIGFFGTKRSPKRWIGK